MIPLEPITPWPTALTHRHVVAVDHLVAAAIAQDRLDLAALMAGNGARVVARIGREAARQLAPGGAPKEEGVAALEPAPDRGAACRQEAGAALQRRRRALVHGQRPHRIDR